MSFEAKKFTDQGTDFQTIAADWAAYCLFKSQRYEELLQLQDTSPQVVYYQTVALLLQGHDETAWEHLRKSPPSFTKQVPKNTLEAYLLSKKIMQQCDAEDLQDTEHFLNELEKTEHGFLKDEDVHVGLWLAFSYQQLGDRNKAQSIFEQLAKTYPFDPNLAHSWAVFATMWATDLVNKGEIDKALRQLEFVIANFAYLLVCEPFWKNWIKVRQESYQTPITDENSASLKTRIEKYVNGIFTQKLAQFNGVEANGLVRQWGIAWEQEVRAARELKTLGRFKGAINGQEVDAGFGPLFMKSRMLEKEIKAFFKSASQTPSRRVPEYLKRLLTASPGQADFDKIFNRLDPKKVTKVKRLFSELGPCEVLIGRGRCQEALGQLEANQFNSVSKPNVIEHVEVRALRGEMITQVQLQIAEDMIREREADFVKAASYWEMALKSCRKWQGLETTKQQIVQTILGRVKALPRKKIDRAVELLESAHAVLPDGRIDGKLAELLRIRAVPKANQAIKDKTYPQLEPCLPDFQRSLKLNPSVKQTRYDLCQVLFVLADWHHKQGNNQKSTELFRENYQVAQDGLSIHKGDKQLNQFLQESRFRLRLVQRPGVARPAAAPNVFVELLAQMLEEAASEQGSTAMHYNRAGVRREREGDYKGAIKEFEKALEIDPSFKQAQRNLKQTVRNYMDHLLKTGDIGRSFEVFLDFRLRYPHLQ